MDDHQEPQEEPEVKRQNLLTRQRAKLLENVRGTSVHGLSRAVTATSRCRRYFWVSLFFASVIGFSAHLIGLLHRYSKQPILMQVSYEHMPFKWPHVTLCNPMNPIPFWERPKLLQVWQDLIERTRLYPSMPYEKTRGHRVRSEMLAMSSIDFNDFFGNRSVNSLIFAVHLDFHRPIIEQSVSEGDRFSLVLNFHEAFRAVLETSRYPLPCYTLTPEAFKSIVSNDKIQRIRLMVYVDQRSYRLFNSGHENRKIYLYLGNRNYTQQISSLFYVHPGTDSYFEISENHIHRLKDCLDEHFKMRLFDVNMHATHELIGGYDDCIAFVSQRIFVQFCGCYNPFLPIVKLDHIAMPRLCFNMTHFSPARMKANVRCLNRVIHRYDKASKFREISEECKKFKKKYCWQSTYTYIRHTNTWDRELNPKRRLLLTKFLKLLRNAPRNASEEFGYHNLLALHFVRKHKKTPFTFEELQYPLSQLLSDVGGSLGLWLGVSVISVFELIDIAIDFGKLLIFTRKQAT